MRVLFDERLTDPTAEELASALLAAAEVVHVQLRRERFSHFADHDAIIGRVLTQSEGAAGYYQSDGRERIQVSLGWWTDTATRKQVRLRVDSRRDHRFGPVSGELARFEARERDRLGRPGVWHLDPERLIEVSRDGVAQWVAVCGCGAAGTAEALGWQHGMCGPCVDRVAELGPEAVRHAPGVLVEELFEPHAVEFTPDGRFVVAIEEDTHQVWDTATGERLPGEGCGRSPRRGPWALVSPSGGLVLFDDSWRALYWASLKDGRVRQTFTLELIPPIRAVVWTGRPRELLVQSHWGLWHLVDVRDGSYRDCAGQHASTLHAIRPDAEAPLAVFAQRNRVWVERIEADGAMTEEAHFELGRGRPDGGEVWQEGPDVVRFAPDGERILFVRRGEMELWHPARSNTPVRATFPQAIRDIAFSPDSEHLFVLGADGTISVCDPQAPARVRARLRWHIDPVRALAVSPDGQTLATAGVEGVKLWPVSRLLPLLE